ncbi:unnamed protein product [Gadus morhua 'NCC']
MWRHRAGLHLHQAEPKTSGAWSPFPESPSSVPHHLALKPDPRVLSPCHISSHQPPELLRSQLLNHSANRPVVDC